MAASEEASKKAEKARQSWMVEGEEDIFAHTVDCDGVRKGRDCDG